MSIEVKREFSVKENEIDEESAFGSFKTLGTTFTTPSTTFTTPSISTASTTRTVHGVTNSWVDIQNAKNRKIEDLLRENKKNKVIKYTLSSLEVVSQPQDKPKSKKITILCCCFCIIVLTSILAVGLFQFIAESEENQIIPIQSPTLSPTQSPTSSPTQIPTSIPPIERFKTTSEEDFNAICSNFIAFGGVNIEPATQNIFAIYLQPNVSFTCNLGATASAQCNPETLLCGCSLGEFIDLRNTTRQDFAKLCVTPDEDISFCNLFLDDDPDINISSFL